MQHSYDIVHQGIRKPGEDAGTLNSLARNLLEKGDHMAALEAAQTAAERARETGNRSELAHSLYTISDCHWRMARYTSALQYARDSTSVFRELSDTYGEAEALASAGNALWRMERYSEALESHANALSLFKALSRHDGIAVCLNNIGIIYRNLNKYNEALEAYRESLRIAQEHNNVSSEAYTLNNIGFVHLQLEEFQEATDCFRKSLKIKQEIGDVQGEANSLNNLAGVCLKLERFEQALEYLQPSLLIRITTSDKRGEALTRNSIGKAYGGQGEFDAALHESLQCVAIWRTLEQKRELAEALQQCGHWNVARGDMAEALQQLEEALALAESTDDKSLLAAIFYDMTHACKGQGNFRRALEAHERFYQYDKVVKEEQALRKTRNMRIFHQMEQARKEAEIERLRNVELEEKNRELRRLNSSLRELSAEKTEFLSIAAHDLKNPLAGITLAAQTMKSYSERLSREDKESYLEKIEQTAFRMSAIITDILDINAIESGNRDYHFTTLDVAALTREICADYAKRAAKKNIRLHCEHSPGSLMLKTDESALSRIIENLLSNAVKYSPHGKNVWVRVSAPGDMLHVTIKDEGPGFSKEDKQHLYQKFKLLSARPTDGEKSTGLGLSIVKKLVESLQGRVWCESEAGKGATFTIELPQ